MSLARVLVERKVSTTHTTLLAGAIAALGLAVSSAEAGVATPQPTLGVEDASVLFPGGSIPADVPANAEGGVSSDGYIAKFTGMIGPITRNAFLLNAPNGGAFNFEGDIVGGVTPGVKICISYEVDVQFTGGKVNWGTGADIFVPRAGVFHESDSAQLIKPSVVMGMYEYEFTDSDPATGMFRFEFAFNWVSASPLDTLTIDVRTVSVEVCSVPAPGAVVLAGLGLGLAAGRRRR